MVEFRNVSVTYGNGVDALNNVNLKVNDGEFAFVIGGSGAGKSTLIKLLLKEVSATVGTVIVNGYNLKCEFSGILSRSCLRMFLWI